MMLQSVIDGQCDRIWRKFATLFGIVQSSEPTLADFLFNFPKCQISKWQKKEILNKL